MQTTRYILATKHARPPQATSKIGTEFGLTANHHSVALRWLIASVEGAVSKTFQFASVAFASGTVTSLITIIIKDSKFAQLIGKFAKAAAIMAFPIMVLEGIKMLPPHIEEVISSAKNIIVRFIEAESRIKIARTQAEIEQIKADAELANAKRGIDAKSATATDSRAVTNTDCKAGRPADIVISACSALIKNFPLQPEPYSIISTAFRMKDDAPKALNYVEKSLELQPNDRMSLLRRGMIFRQLNDAQRAATDFDAVLQLIPKSAMDFAIRGLASELIQRPGYIEQAERDYDTAIKMDRTLALAFSRKAEVLLASNRTAKSLPEIDHAIQLDETNAGYYDIRGRIHVELVRLSDAIDDFGRSIAFDPASPTSYRNRGHVYLKLQKYPESVSDLRAKLCLEHNKK
jgi:tetratricopeptide (TPR) repeat protein